MSTLTIYRELERWRAIPGHEGVYEVSDLGRVRSYHQKNGRLRDKPRLKALTVNQVGYLSVTLQVESGRSRAFTVHTLVAAAFLGPRPDGYHVAHGDGDRTNARLDNLRYATPVENFRDMEAHGTWPRGEANGRRKLTEQDVRDIFRRHRAGESQGSLAAAYGVRRQSISNIVCGIRWAHLGLVEVG